MTDSADGSPEKPVDLRKLLRAINDSFSEDDLRDLYFELQLDFENLPGTVKKDKVRELIIYFDRRKRVNDLVDAFSELRPNIDIEAIIVEEVDEWPSDSDPNSLKNEGPLSINVFSAHAKASAWNQGAPLSPFEFIIKLDVVNQSRNPIILRSFDHVAFEVPNQLLKQGSPISKLLIVKDNHSKFPATFPYQIPGEYFGLIEYHITVRLDNQQRLRFIPDSEAFQNYSIELSYEYYDMTRINYADSILVESTFQEFKVAWLEMWNSHKLKLLRQGITDNAVQISLESFEQPIIPESNDKWVSIKVINNENDHLTSCYGVLEVDGMPLQLGWSGGSTGVRNILRGSSALLDIARTLKEKEVFAFTTQNRGDWPQKKPGKYIIQVTIGGDFKGRSFAPLFFEGYVEYTGGKDLVLVGEPKVIPADKAKSTSPTPVILKQPPSRWKKFNNE